MAAIEKFMIEFVCSSKGVFILPFAPGLVLLNPFSIELFAFAWATVLLMFFVFSVAPCASNLNCARVSLGETPSSIVINSIASTGDGAMKRVTYTGDSGFAAAIQRGSTVTIESAANNGFNGTFTVTDVTDTTVVVRSITLGSENPTSATITSYTNYQSLRDTQKALSYAVLYFYILFLILGVFGRFFLCKTKSANAGGQLSGLSKAFRTYEIPQSNKANLNTAKKEARIERANVVANAKTLSLMQETQNTINAQAAQNDLILQASQQVEQARVNAAIRSNQVDQTLQRSAAISVAQTKPQSAVIAPVALPPLPQSQINISQYTPSMPPPPPPLPPPSLPSTYATKSDNRQQVYNEQVQQTRARLERARENVKQAAALNAEIKAHNEEIKAAARSAQINASKRSDQANSNMPVESSNGSNILKEVLDSVSGIVSTGAQATLKVTQSLGTLANAFVSEDEEL